MSKTTVRARRRVTKPPLAIMVVAGGCALFLLLPLIGLILRAPWGAARR